MAKLALTILVFRILQLGLALAFLVFWSWACAARYAVGGGAGEYFLGYFSALASLAVCIHGIWSFLRKRNFAEGHSLGFHHARWAVDLVLVVLWLGAILVGILVPVPREDWARQLGGGPSPDSSTPPPSATDAIVVVGGGVNATELFLAITLFMTSLLLVIPAVRAHRANKRANTDTATSTVREKGPNDATAGEKGVPASEPVQAV